MVLPAALLMAGADGRRLGGTEAATAELAATGGFVCCSCDFKFFLLRAAAEILRSELLLLDTEINKHLH